MVSPKNRGVTMSHQPGILNADNDNDISMYPEFLDYRTVVISAIAKAWAEPDYWHELSTNPKKALWEGFGYKFPFDMHLHCNHNSANYCPELVADWVSVEFSSITLVLPPAPPDGTDRTMALADYNLNHLTFLKVKSPPSIKLVLAFLEKAFREELIKDLKNQKDIKEMIWKIANDPQPTDGSK
jgi:ribosomally synthesized peptide (two-chain TOMM family)